MADLISREKAINTAYSMRKVCDTDNIDDYHDLIVAALKDLPPSQRWIPCGERLPEEDGLYLVTTNKRQVQMHVFSHNGNSEEYWNRCNKAWMPLPEPYRPIEE